MVLMLQHSWFESPGRLVKTQGTGPTPGVFDSGDLGWDPKIGISIRFPGDAETTEQERDRRRCWVQGTGGWPPVFPPLVGARVGVG